ncbi:hypothetical protein [Adhaeribacter radiodurans]|uniref:Class I SAM-dependent methyltransferase n=1 Tax=Adhaeribacter radiodurans TaxID=2745197 RepID=A0A7L7L454_9BACT|nr:hypothetical protein [Adhaeribacter radiodurans]QMU27560.1 hypothetical protein HUW48_05675 [Adhaeribacter radiodurans]
MINRKIKNLIGTSSLVEEISQLRKLTLENYWANVFRSSTNGCSWVQNESFNVGRWAANYSLLYILFRALNEAKPLNTLELGLGETTKVFQAYKKGHNQNAFCATVEHDKSWIDLKKQNGILPEYINIIISEVIEQKIFNSKSLVYKDLVENLKELNKKFNLILIDGPFGSSNYSRYNIIDLVNENFLDDDFIIIIDDFQRKGEKDTFEELKRVLIKNNNDCYFGFYGGDKEQVVVCSEKYKFLTTA